jgi:hypothetical protein
VKLCIAILSRPRRPARRSAAFSLIEVLVVTGLLSVIIFGLVLMFSQTQRAYRLGTTQVDVLEGGRMVTDLMTRDLAQIRPANQASGIGVTNFNVEVLPFPYTPLEQRLPGSGLDRTNVFQDVFFLTRENGGWRGIGYVVRTSQGSSGFLNRPGAEAGTLYRIDLPVTDATFRNTPYLLNNLFLAAIQNETNPPVSKLLDGVVHFVVRTYDSQGLRIEFDHPDVFQSAPGVYGMRLTNAFYPKTPIVNEVQLRLATSGFGEIGCAFQSNAVPASVEVELGILESREVERARSIKDSGARQTFLEQQVGKVHLFRWRVPIRNHDPSAFR